MKLSPRAHGVLDYPPVLDLLHLSGIIRHANNR